MYHGRLIPTSSWSISLDLWKGIYRYREQVIHTVELEIVIIIMYSCNKEIFHQAFKL